MNEPMKSRRSLVDALHLRHTIDALKLKTVPHHRADIFYYMGGLALFFFIIQIVSGILLLFYYEPSATGAYKSIQRIMTQVPFGSLIRSIHSWSANALGFCSIVLNMLNKNEKY